MSKTTAMTIASKRRLDLLDEMASSDFASLEEKTRRRHREAMNRISTMEDRMATFTGTLGREAMELESSHQFVRTQLITQPLEGVVHRIADRVLSSSDQSTKRLVQIEETIRQLTHDMTEFETRTIVPYNKEHQSSMEKISLVQDSVQLERYKAEKREWGLQSRCDSNLVAQTTVQWAKVRAENKALLHFMEEQVHNIAGIDERRTEDFQRKVVLL
mmetsp:Transcript_15379/g.21920  ORF Transcript_15379/g.21920 Transcript_15379/m.21920 type:complete len:216 (+) Transcript_15379:126-773(+)